MLLSLNTGIPWPIHSPTPKEPEAHFTAGPAPPDRPQWGGGGVEEPGSPKTPAGPGGLSRCLCAPPCGVSAPAEPLFLPVGCWGSPAPGGRSICLPPAGPLTRGRLGVRVSGTASAARGAWCGAVLGGAGKGRTPCAAFLEAPGGLLGTPAAGPQCPEPVSLTFVCFLLLWL